MEYYKKMTLVPTRAGLMCQCVYCNVTLTPEDADKHTQEECESNNV